MWLRRKKLVIRQVKEFAVLQREKDRGGFERECMESREPM
jgi:hypothetical protein